MLYPLLYFESKKNFENRAILKYIFFILQAILQISKFFPIFSEKGIYFPYTTNSRFITMDEL